MLAFHQLLNAGARDPAAALRAAQLWMLDPDRGCRRMTGPSSAPRPPGPQPGGPDLTSIEAWAGFTYQGR